MQDEKKALLHELLEPENQHETVALARALCPFAESASDATMLICVALVEADGDDKAVSEAIGYSRARIRAHTQSELSARIIRKLAKERLSGRGYLTAVAALVSVAGSASQTGTARANASKRIIELVNQDEASDPVKREGDVDLSSMSQSELSAYVASIKGLLSRQVASDASEHTDSGGLLSCMPEGAPISG